MPVTGQQLVAKNIILYGKRFLETVNGTMDKVREKMDRQITKNISLTDHSLKELRKLDHPYAVRHGASGKSLHSPNYQVHKQSGKLVSSKHSGVDKATISEGKLQAVAFVYLDPKQASHALHVVYGTSKMIPRPVLQESRREILQESVELIKKNLKNLTFNFNR